MVDIDRSLERLRESQPIVQAVFDENEVNALLCPPHGQRSDVCMRVGQDKRGRLTLFEPICENPDPNSWRQVGPCSARLCKRLQPLIEKLEVRPGPRGAVLFYFTQPKK